MPITRTQARAAKTAIAAAVADHPQVVGVGIAKVGDDLVVKVNVRDAAPPNLPESVDGVPVHVEVVGPVVKR